MTILVITAHRVPAFRRAYAAILRTIPTPFLELALAVAALGATNQPAFILRFLQAYSVPHDLATVAVERAYAVGNGRILTGRSLLRLATGAGALTAIVGAGHAGFLFVALAVAAAAANPHMHAFTAFQVAGIFGALIPIVTLLLSAGALPIIATIQHRAYIPVVARCVGQGKHFAYP